MRARREKPSGRDRALGRAQVDRRSAPVNAEAVRARAYEIFCARGDGDGDELGDWLEAERQLGVVRGDRDEERNLA